jgi:hypothetical protein
MERDESKTDRQGDLPSDKEGLVGDTAASEPLTSKPRVQPSEAEERDNQDREWNPPHTTTGNITSPAFGSGVSGGALADPGPPRD